MMEGGKVGGWMEGRRREKGGRERRNGRKVGRKKDGKMSICMRLEFIEPLLTYLGGVS
jgi:hypothetical protein